MMSEYPVAYSEGIDAPVQSLAEGLDDRVQGVAESAAQLSSQIQGLIPDGPDRQQALRYLDLVVQACQRQVQDTAPGASGGSSQEQPGT